MSGKRCKVIKEHRSSFPEPVIAKKGEILTIGERDGEEPGWIWCINKQGNGAWISLDYLIIQGNQAEISRDYDSTELNVSKGQILDINTESQGWFWVKDESNAEGWVPIRNVEIID